LLVSYPVEAAEENWLHESLLHGLKVVHKCLDNNDVIPEWADLLPATLSKEQASLLTARPGISSRVFKYAEEIRHLPPNQRDEIFTAMTDQNEFFGMIDGSVAISTLLPKYPLVQEAARDLFTFAYDALTALGVRDRQYRVIFAKLKDKICPFCGVERIMSPQEARQDLDHYLAKSIYPFAAVNMINLFPMCRCCNRDYKSDYNILIDGNGVRRKAFDPYKFPQIEMDLRKSVPFAGTNQTHPAWWVQFTPYSEELQCWDETFSISIRYSRDILNHGFSRWLDSFRVFCARVGYKNNLTDEQVLDILKTHYDRTTIDNPAGVDFLKPKVFDMLIHYFESNDERVIKFVRDMVTGLTV
jgi:hypothetical protein